MKIVAYNEQMLDRACGDIYRTLFSFGSVYIDYGQPLKEKTKRQLGFFWGALVDSIRNFYREKGIEYEPDEIKENFYQVISPKKTITRFNGDKYEVPKRISEMSSEEMSEFIDKAIWLCDNAKVFEGLILHPSIRYTWVQRLTKDEIRQALAVKLPIRDNAYLAYQRKQACLCCGAYNRTEAHHLRLNGAGGTAIKPPDYLTIPLCQECHRNYHIKGHLWFKDNVKWIEKYMPISEFAQICYNKYHLKR